MAKQKRKKFTATATPDKTPPEKPLVELSKEQLEAISKRSAERQRAGALRMLN